MDRAREITCLCPTYGRFGLLRRSVAMFLNQTEPERRLLILNDAPRPITLGEFRGRDTIQVLNARPDHQELGEKRSRLLREASTSLVAHWDDDDVYLPHHLQCGVTALVGASGEAWCVVGRPCLKWEGGKLTTVTEAGKTAGYVFCRSEAVARAGYRRHHTGRECHRWRRLGGVLDYDLAEPSFVWCPDTPGLHTRANGPAVEHHLGNRDFGTELLTPDYKGAEAWRLLTSK